MSSPSHIDSKTNEEEQKTTEIQVVPVVANKYSISKKCENIGANEMRIGIC